MKKQKSIKDISDKHIDDFSENLKKKAKKIKETNKKNIKIAYRDTPSMDKIIILIGKMQDRYKLEIDWEEVACEIIAKYYEQQEYIQEYNSNLKNISNVARDIYGEHNNV